MTPTSRTRVVPIKPRMPARFRLQLGPRHNLAEHFKAEVRRHHLDRGAALGLPLDPVSRRREETVMDVVGKVPELREYAVAQLVKRLAEADRPGPSEIGDVDRNPLASAAQEEIPKRQPVARIKPDIARDMA